MSFTVSKQTTDAHYPRARGSTLLESDRLKLVYHKYKTTKQAPPGAIKHNLIFAHGTGFNKSAWKYHIEKLYAQSSPGFFLDSVVAIDAVGHGDSGYINRKVLGWVCDWGEGGKDINAVVKHEQRTSGDFKNDRTSRNIAIGHSFGGHCVVMASFFEPALYDAVIPIEAVIYGNEDSVTRFTKIFSKLSTLIIDDFDTKDDYEEYYHKFSFFKTLHPQVLKDFIADEIYEEKDEDGEVHYKSKASNFGQMTCYLGSSISVAYCMAIQRLLKVPVFHVVGDNAKWNPPESVTFFREQVPPHLLSTYNVPGGEHLLTQERPDDTVQFISDYVAKRHTEFKKELQDFPETKYNFDRDQIRESQKDLVSNGKIDLLSGYEHIVRPKL